MESYYGVFCGTSAKALLNWGDYLKDLEKAKNPTPEGKTLSEFRQMKDDYRNPLMHPRVVLTESDARMSFNNGESLIIAMAQEIAQHKANSQPSLALVPSSASLLGPGNVQN